MASDPRLLQRLSRITAEVDRAASRETIRRLGELERRLSTLEQSGVRAGGSELDSIRVRSLEGRAADVEAAVKGVQEELRELKLRVEAVSTEAAARSNTLQMALQEVRRLLEERAGPMKMLEVEMRQQAAKAEQARNELQRWMERAEPLLKAAGAWEALGPEGTARVQRLPEAFVSIEKLAAGLQRVEQATGQVAARVEGLVKAGEEAAAVLEELKRAVEPLKGGPSPAQVEQRLAAVEREARRWEDLGEVLLTLREGLGALQKETARIEALEKRGEMIDAHDREIARLTGVAEELLRAVEEVRKAAAPPQTERISGLEKRLDEQERTLQKFATVAEEVLKGVEAMEERRKEIEAALRALRESPVDGRLREIEMNQAKVTGAVEHLLKQVDDLEGGLDRLRRVVMQQAGQRAEGT